MLVYLLLLQASLPGVIHVVQVVADRVAKRLLFRSPVFTPHIDLRVSMDSFDLLTYRGGGGVKEAGSSCNASYIGNMVARAAAN